MACNCLTGTSTSRIGATRACSQPTVSRWENAPGLRDLIRLMGVMVDLYCYTKPPTAVTLDIDDTVDVVHGHQQLSLFNAHYDERCFLPIHVYDTATSRPVAVLLRPGKTPSGTEIRGHLRRLVPPHTQALAGDAHYHPRRRSLRPPGGHAVVRGEWHRLHLRSARQRRARPAGRRVGRRHSHPPRARPEGMPARLCRDKLSGEILEHRPPLLCPDRGHQQGPRSGLS
jgi:hypothetical protein